MCRKPSTSIFTSFQYPSYAVPIDGHVAKKQCGGLMDARGFHLPIRKPNTTKQWQKKTATSFFLIK
jgi:hypothetical protein